MLRVLPFALLLFVVCGLAQLFLPWWVVLPICAAAGFWLGRAGASTFLAGFLGVGAGWGVAAAVPWLLTGSALPGRVAALLHLPGGGLVLVLLAGVLSGLVGGLAAVTGWWLRRTGGRGTVESPHSAGPE